MLARGELIVDWPSLNERELAISNLWRNFVRQRSEHLLFKFH
jgi:hypothetical protein